jgi:Tfp pilus assembly protein PilF
MAFFEMRLFEAAIEEFAAASLDTGPQLQADCLIMIGRCQLQRGAFDEARAACQRALGVSPIAPETSAEAERLFAQVEEAAGLFTP